MKLRRAFAAARRFARDLRGATAVEYAFVAPIFLVFLIGSVDAGRAVWIKSSLEKAANDAARCAALSAANCPDVPAFAASRVTGITISSGAFTYNAAASCGVTGSTNGKQVSVAYTYDALSMMLLPSFNGISLTATACHF